MKLLRISKSDKKAMVDDEDYARLTLYTWGFNGTGIWTKINGKSESLPRTIFKNNLMYDHIDHDLFNNQKSNLRLCTHSQNMFNRKKIKSKTSSKYKGVYWHKLAKAWVAYIQVKNKRIYLGLYDTEEKAALRYNKAAINCHGEFAYLNKIIYEG